MLDATKYEPQLELHLFKDLTVKVTEILCCFHFSSFLRLAFLECLDAIKVILGLIIGTGSEIYIMYLLHLAISTIFDLDAVANLERIEH